MTTDALNSAASVRGVHADIDVSAVKASAIDPNHRTFHSAVTARRSSLFGAKLVGIVKSAFEASGAKRRGVRSSDNRLSTIGKSQALNCPSQNLSSCWKLSHLPTAVITDIWTPFGAKQNFQFPRL
jgi:hypothetical protein